LKARPRCAFIAAIAAALAAPAGAQISIPDPQRLIEQGRLDEAADVLDERARSGRATTQELFLAGIVAVEQHKYRRAIDHFRAALVREPKSARLRLELARAFYLAKDYRNAAFQFERALAGDLPAPVAANARRFLEHVRNERRWSSDVTLGIAPDTNINAGSSAREIALFGLPFELGSDARRKSGLGLAVGGSISFSPRLSNHWRWQFGIDAQRRDYRGSSFDDTIMTAWTGPQWISDRAEISAAATSLTRWFGPRLYQWAQGGRLAATIYPGPRTGFTIGATAQDFTYPTFRAQSGPVLSASLGVVRVIDPATTVALQLGIATQRARAKDLSNRSALFLTNLTHDFKGGFTLSITPSFALSNYDSPDVFFGVRRRDRAKEVQVVILNRRTVIWRFTPTLTYTGLRRASSIGLYRSKQDRLEFGLTSSF
jgi:hypothetical protein